MTGPSITDYLQLVLMCVSIIGGIALQTWGIIRYLIGRQDRGDGTLHERINTLRDNAVMRPDYNRDMERIHGDMSAVRAEVTKQGQATTARLDQLILAVSDRTPKG